MAVNLTDRTMRSLENRPAAPGKRYMLWDQGVTSLGIRVGDQPEGKKKPHLSWIVMKRLDGKVIRRTLGSYPKISVEAARQQAREMLKNIEMGVDPKALKESEQRARERKRIDSFEKVADLFIVEHVNKLRTAAEIRAIIEKKMKSRWATRPIAEIIRADIVEAIKELTKRSPAAGRKFYTVACSFFGWAVDQQTYGIELSPCFGIKPKRLGATLTIRDRILTDGELRLFWKATGKIAYPFGPLFRFLLLVAQRRDEVANMSWSEIDFKAKLWTIPKERMKTDAPNVLPISEAAVELLKFLPQFSGPYVFTTTEGMRPVSGFSKAKIRLDRMMLDIRQTETPEKGDPATAIINESWRLHDLRRTARTHFSAIPSQELVRELAIGHTKPGLHKVYDQFTYMDEKRALFESWSERLSKIVTPENFE